jgi:DTW domain-containing protein YfiP
VYASTCDTCHRPTVACVCDRITSYPTQRRILILQHPQEQDALLGSAQILVASLPKARLVVGLSWPNLGAALGEEGVDVRRWAVLFPQREAVATPGPSTARASVPPSALEGIVVLDGTWSKAKTLWWRNPWLSKLSRLTLEPKKPSIYGRLRAEPRRDFVSTLESVAAALTLCGEAAEIEAGLERVFRTLVQRVRDAGIVPKTSGRQRKTAASSTPHPARTPRPKS